MKSTTTHAIEVPGTSIGVADLAAWLEGKSGRVSMHIFQGDQRDPTYMRLTVTEESPR